MEIKALPAPGHDHADRLTRYLAAVAALEAAAWQGGAEYAEALHRHTLALSHLGETPVFVTEKVEEAA